MMDGLQFVIALVIAAAGGGTLGTITRSLLDRRTSKARTELEKRSIDNSNQQAFTDDLLKRLDQMDRKAELQDRKIEAQDQSITELKQRVGTLESEKRSLVQYVYDLIKTLKKNDIEPPPVPNGVHL